MIKRKGLSVLLSAAMVCSIIFSGCASEDTTETKNTSETTSKNDENVSDNKNGDSSSDNNNEDNSSDGNKKDNSSDNKKDKKKDTNKKNGKYNPGDVVSFGNFKITYKSVKKYKSDNRFLQPKKGFQYVKYSFTFKNTGKDDAYVGNFSCYANGEKCETAYVSDSDNSLILTELSAGRKTNGSIIFEVPKKVKLKDLELEYEDNSLWSDKKIIFLGK